MEELEQRFYGPFNQDFGIGAEIFRVKQRDFDMRLNFNNYMTTTGFINFHYIEPRSQVIFALKQEDFLLKILVLF